MKRKIIVSAILAVSTAMQCVSFSFAKEDEKPIYNGVYYNDDGELVGVKTITGTPSDEEISVLLNVMKPEDAKRVKVYQWNGDMTQIEAQTEHELKEHDINIISTGDIHGYVTDTGQNVGLDKVATLKKLTKNSLLLDAGNATQGAIYAAVSRGADMIQTMNVVGYDGMTLGNHEFDYGFDVLRDNVSMAQFPCFGANVSIPENSDGKSIGIKNNQIYEINGKKVGVFGIVTSYTKRNTKSNGFDGVEFSDEIENAKEQINELHEAGADVIIAVTHLGVNDRVPVSSVELAQELSGTELDLIIDGHSHDLLCTDAFGIPIIQSGAGDIEIGSVGIDVNDDGTVSVDMNLLSRRFFGNIDADENVKKFIDATVEEQTSQFDQTIAYTSQSLWGGEIQDVYESRTCETNLGDYICDVMIYAAENSLDPKYANSKIVSVENGGGLQDTIKNGDISWKDVLSVLPFSNLIVVKEITPGMLYELLETGLDSSIKSQYTETGRIESSQGGSFLQVGGMRFEYNPNGEAGSRVLNIYCDGDDAPLDRNDNSTKMILATNDYVSGGSGGFDMLAQIPSICIAGGLAEKVVEYISGYNAENPLVYPITQNRIKTVSDYQPKDYTARVYICNTKDAPVTDKEITYYVDGEERKGKTDSDGVLLISVSDGVHSVKAGGGEIYVNNYSGMGLEGITMPKLTADL